MDAEEDSLFYSNEKLKNLIQESSDTTATLQQYFQDVHYLPINDFKLGLEWFNVTEPLSFSKHLKGKVVVLDFFTYCCINCMHILPDLKEIEEEFSVEDGLVVIGVHSAKFQNEKQSANVVAAVQRYNINHPVVNDYDSDMWKKCNVMCWPTLLLLGPGANPLVMLTGEGHKKDLKLYIKNALRYYKEKKLLSSHKLPLKSANHLLAKTNRGPLLFPGKIATFVDGKQRELLAVSDSGNHRILILRSNGHLVTCFGGNQVGLKDGNNEQVQFNNPQGLVFQNEYILYVADCDNHAIRRLDLKRNAVETVAGTGVQGHDKIGGKRGVAQAISSPWDLCIYRMEGDKDLLLIAMAGTHQIWGLFLHDTKWWKGKEYSAGMCVSLAGSGKEENRNNMYPHAAAFAQPSGLALSPRSKELYIADSESSSVRRLSLLDGKVSAVVGGDRNPSNLFAFGDQDGALFEARLQHSLGIALSRDEKTLFVADTYNHKLKKVDIDTNTISTLCMPASDTTDGSTSSLSEPAGLCTSADGRKLYLADTNNHTIKVVDLLEGNAGVKHVRNLDIKLVDRSKFQVLKSSPLCLNCAATGGLITFNVTFKNALNLTADAVQEWWLQMPHAAWCALPKFGTNLNNVQVVLTFLGGSEPVDDMVEIIFNLVTCTPETCLPKCFIVQVPVHFAKEVGNSNELRLEIVLDPCNIVVS